MGNEWLEFHLNKFKYDFFSNLRVRIVSASKLIWKNDTDFNKGAFVDTEVNGVGDAALVQPVAQEGDIPYTTEANYTLSDGAKLEVASGLAKLKGTSITPYAWWHLNESSGTNVPDSSGNGRNGTTQNMEDSDWVAAKLNNGLRFDGIDEYVDCGAIAAFERTQAFSLECWFKISAGGTYIVISNRDDTGNLRGWALHMTAGQLFFNFLSDVGTVDRLQVKTDNTYNDGVFHHMVLTYDGSSSASGVTFYVDGSTVAQTTVFDSLTSTTVSVINTHIGILNGTGFPWLGDLDEVLIYSQELTAAQVSERWNSGDGTEDAISAGFPTDDNLFIDTKTASQITVAGITAWDVLTDISTLPASTDIRVLFSNDGRSTWLTWSGSAWVTEASPTLRANATVLATAITNFAALPVGSSTLDVRLFLFTSDSISTPSVSNFNALAADGFPVSSTWETNIFNNTSPSQDWGGMLFTVTLPGGTTVTIVGKASNVSDLSDTSYGSALSNLQPSNLTGQYIQFKVTFTGTTSVRSLLDDLAVTFQTVDLPEEAP